MRIYMQTRPAAEAPRYYQLLLEQDLLGGWTLYREWGQQGGRPSARKLPARARMVRYSGR